MSSRGEGGFVPNAPAWTVWFGEGAPAADGALAEIRVDGRANSAERASLRVFGDAGQAHSHAASLNGCSALFFGKLWNRDEVAREVGESPQPLADDAAVVAAAYLRWGPEFLDRIRGVFSLVIFDRSRKELFCARDPMGIWPLFYASTPSGLVLSTSIPALLRFPGVSRAVNRASVALILSNLNQRKDETFYEAIERIPAGHTLHCANGTRRIARYWDPVPKCLPSRNEGIEALEQFDFLVEQGVSRCLQWGRPGFYLSGGIDSVSVAVTATELCRKHGLPPPMAFSLVFPDQQANEEPIQRGVAAALGIEQFIMNIEEAAGPGGLLLNAMEISRNMAAPTLTMWLPAYHRLSREAVARGCKAIFTGGGGDEWMGNSPFLVADRLQALDFPSVYQQWSTIRKSFRVPPIRLAWALLWRWGLRPLMGGVAADFLTAKAPSLLKAKRFYTRELPKWISADPKLRQEIEEHTEPTILASEVGGFYLREVRRFLDHFLVAWEMEAIFENERLTGIPILQPLFDPDLLRLLCLVAPELLASEGRSKGPARRLVANKLPSLGFDKQKKVLGTNYFKTVGLREGRAGWDALGGVPSLAEFGVVDERKWKLTMDSVLREDEPKELFQLWSSLSVEAWLRPRI